MLPAPSVRPSPRRGSALLVLLLTAAVRRASGTGTAQAADGYKYWNYFHVTDGKYVFATTGPADYTPEGRLGGGLPLRPVLDRRRPRTRAPRRRRTRSTTSARRVPPPRPARSGSACSSTTAPPADAARGETPAEATGGLCRRARPRPTASRCSTRSPTCGWTSSCSAASTATRSRRCSVTVKNPPAAAEGAAGRLHGAGEAVRETTRRRPPRTPTTAASRGRWPVALGGVVVIGGGAVALSRRNRSA